MKNAPQRYYKNSIYENFLQKKSKKFAYIKKKQYLCTRFCEMKV